MRVSGPRPPCLASHAFFFPFRLVVPVLFPSSCQAMHFHPLVKPCHAMPCSSNTKQATTAGWLGLAQRTASGTRWHSDVEYLQVSWILSFLLSKERKNRLDLVESKPFVTVKVILRAYFFWATRTSEVDENFNSLAHLLIGHLLTASLAHSQFKRAPFPAFGA